MLDTTLKAQLQGYLERLVDPVELVVATDDGEPSRQLRALADDIAALSSKITVRDDSDATRVPSFAIARAGEPARVRFAGLPLGHEFSSLVLALLQVSGHPPRVEPAVAEQIRALPAGLDFDVVVSLSCHNCPDVVQA
ncbi:MAG TPA: alkyl hydroperoxide reductase, partial [Moraxellaceae bacterium]|nr:alkyl hydroperoxide reductase [Moraxellaceae bacterium]